LASFHSHHHIACARMATAWPQSTQTAIAWHGEDGRHRRRRRGCSRLAKTGRDSSFRPSTGPRPKMAAAICARNHSDDQVGPWIPSRPACQRRSTIATAGEADPAKSPRRLVPIAANKSSRKSIDTPRRAWYIHAVDSLPGKSARNPASGLT
jgi:hypothetical protein